MSQPYLPRIQLLGLAVIAKNIPSFSVDDCDSNNLLAFEAVGRNELYLGYANQFRSVSAPPRIRCFARAFLS